MEILWIEFFLTSAVLIVHQFKRVVSGDEIGEQLKLASGLLKVEAVAPFRLLPTPLAVREPWKGVPIAAVTQGLPLTSLLPLGPLWDKLGGRKRGLGRANSKCLPNALIGPTFPFWVLASIASVLGRVCHAEDGEGLVIGYHLSQLHDTLLEEIAPHFLLFFSQALP